MAITKKTTPAGKAADAVKKAAAATVVKKAANV